MEKVIELIHNFFKKGKLKYNYDEKKHIFTSGVKMNGVLGNLRLYVLVHENFYMVYAVVNGIPEKENYREVAEYLHRVNYGMYNGNFEFDYRNGEIRYKTFVNFDHAQLSMQVVGESILIPLLMFDRYGKNLLRIMLGDGDPEELVRQAEKDLEDEDTSEAPPTAP